MSLLRRQTDGQTDYVIAISLFRTLFARYIMMPLTYKHRGKVFKQVSGYKETRGLFTATLPQGWGFQLLLKHFFTVWLIFLKCNMEI